MPHDTLVDFSRTTAGHEWLDEFGRRAADQIPTNRNPDAVVVGHADWYAGNSVVADGALVGTFDWELVADTEAVIAGFAAACYGQSATSAGGPSSPEQVADFMRDYDSARAEPLTETERRTAVGSSLPRGQQFERHPPVLANSSDSSRHGALKGWRQPCSATRIFSPT